MSQLPPAYARLVEQAEAGNQLFYALYHLPKEKVVALLADASPGLVRAWGRAQAAYIGGGCCSHVEEAS